jgi:hypothetical protein
VKSIRLASACKGALRVSRKNKHSGEQSSKSIEDQILFEHWIEKLDVQEIRNKDIEVTPQAQKNRKIRKVRIDLHGLTVEQALSKLGRLIDEQLQRAGKFELMVITGKGIRSSGRPVLAREAWDFVSSRYMSQIERIEDSPAEVLLGGIPIRGHFNVVFKG